MDRSISRVVASTILLVSAIFGLSACGGGGGGSSSVSGGDSAQLPTVSLSGVVADGYLGFADVCLDTDSDNSCSGEATLTQTDANGNFTLEATAEDLARYPVVSEVVEGVTTDPDRITDTNPTGVIPVGEGYTLSSPPGLVDADGKPFVSPLTTLVENERQRIIRDDPEAVMAANEALASIASRLGISSVDAEAALTADYIAGADSADAGTAAQAEQLHVVAQVTAGLLADAEAEIDAAIASGDLTQADIGAATLAALDQVSNQLDDINTQIEELLVGLASQALSEAEQAVALEAAIANTVNANDVVDADTLSDVVDIDNASTQPLTAVDMLQLDGGIWLPFLEDCYDLQSDTEIGCILSNRIGFDESINPPSIDELYDYDSSAGARILNDASRTEIVLTSEGWEEITDSYTWTMNDDSSVSGSLGGDKLISIDTDTTELHLEGLGVAAIMGLYKTAEDEYHWPNILLDDALFSSSAIAYIYSITKVDSYQVDDLEVMSSSRFSSNFQEYTTVEQMISTEAIEFFNTGINSGAEFFQIGETQGGPNNVGVDLFVSLFDGEATYFIHDGLQYSFLVEDTYISSNVNGEAVLTLELPSELEDYGVFRADGDTTQLAYSAYDGFVRNVNVERGESVMEIAFNEAALDDVLAAVDADLLPLANRLPSNLSVFADSITVSFPETIPSYEAAPITSLEGDFQFYEFVVTNEDHFLLEQGTDFFIRAEVDLLRMFDGRVIGRSVTAASLVDGAGNLIFDLQILPNFNFQYISRVDGEGDTAIYRTCFRTVAEVESGEFACTEDVQQTYFSLDEETIRELIAELNQALNNDFNLASFE